MLEILHMSNFITTFAPTMNDDLSYQLTLRISEILSDNSTRKTPINGRYGCTSIDDFAATSVSMALPEESLRKA